MNENLRRTLFMLFRMAAPAALGALGATLLIIYPEGFHAFCGR